jgi:hypothetical protein
VVGFDIEICTILHLQDETIRLQKYDHEIDDVFLDGLPGKYLEYISFIPEFVVDDINRLENHEVL